MNGLLDAKRAEQDKQVAFVHELLNKAEADGGRDLVEAEQKSLTAARERIDELGAQIGPMEEFEARASRIAESRSVIVPPRSSSGPVGFGGNAREVYRSAGDFLVDVLKARGIMADGRGSRSAPDSEAESRVRYALQNQTTTDTPGLLPHTIIGQVVSLIDATRPFITSIGGARPMGGIAGKTFGRPKITQHTLAGEQTAEKTELPSRKMVIGEVPFTKRTKGGAVDVSRQDIDWSSPAAWDILIADLADAYAIDTENEAADDFVAKSTTHAPNQGLTVPGDTLEDWSASLYQAAGLVYASSKRLPNRLWISTDQWSAIGPLLDGACCASNRGESSLSSFSGNLFDVDRIVVPSFPAGTVILGWDRAYEVYEEVIGLLTAVEPLLLGVEVAYGGYIAFNYIAAEAVAPITPPAGAVTARQSSSKS